MAGWRKKNRRNASRKNKGASSLEHKLLLLYLREYRERALAHYSESVSQQPPSPREHHPLVEQTGTQPITIQGVELPILANSDVIEQPYLSFPKELSGYHRSLIHDICTDTLQLFHCGVDGTNEGERFVAVSIYSDGLDFVPGLEDTDSVPPAIPMRIGMYKPWIMKKDVDSMSRTEEQKKLIWKMIDQPGRCLRDAHDAIDLSAMKDDNLSTIDPPKAGDSTCLLVDSTAKMEQCIRELEENKPTELGFDIECYNKRKEQQMTCLIQLATNDGREYVIDVLAGKDAEVWEKVSGLANIFADKTVVKIGHGIRGLDVQSLQRDFGIFIVNAFDTYEAASILKLKGTGLAHVCAHYGLQNSELYDGLKKKYQATDWTRRPLTEDMILYGRYDVHFLTTLRKLLMRDLVDQYDNTIQVFDATELRMNLRLMQSISKSQDNCLKLWNTKPEPHLENKYFLSFAAQSKKEGSDLTKSQLSLYSKLASWRESVAKEEESLPGVICSLDYLVRIAIHRPVSETGLRQIQHDLPRFLIGNDQNRLDDLLGFVRTSLVEDNLVKDDDDSFPMYAELKNLAKNTSEEACEPSNLRNIILPNLVFWVATSATLSALVWGIHIGTRKRKR